jgi:hypothetical protein
MQPRDPLRPLKIMVVVMGVVLVIGTMVLIYATFQRVGKKEETLSAAAVISSFSGRECSDATLNIPSGSRIQYSHIEGGVAHLVLRQGRNLKILNLDLCSGKRINAIRLEPETGAATVKEVP